MILNNPNAEIADARLSDNVLLSDASQTITGQKQVDTGVICPSGSDVILGGNSFDWSNVPTTKVKPDGFGVALTISAGDFNAGPPLVGGDGGNLLLSATDGHNPGGPYNDAKTGGTVTILAGNGDGDVGGSIIARLGTGSSDGSFQVQNSATSTILSVSSVGQLNLTGDIVHSSGTAIYLNYDNWIQATDATVTDNGGGFVYLYGGLGDGNGDGGSVLINAGAAQKGISFTNAGGAVEIVAGDGQTTAGPISLRAGEAVAGGYIELVAGAGSSDNGGSINLTGGESTDANGGSLQFRGGEATNSGTGGGIQLSAGDSYSGDGGDIEIYAGDSNNTGSGGNVTIQSGSGTTPGNVTIDTFTGTGSTIYLGNFNAQVVNIGNASGVVNAAATIYETKDFVCTNASNGFVLLDGNGHYWRITVTNAGALTTTDLGTSLP